MKLQQIAGFIMVSAISLAAATAVVSPASGAPPMPKHAGGPVSIVETTTIAQFEAGDFLESILVTPEQKAWITSLGGGRLYRVDLASGKTEVFPTGKEALVGLAPAEDGGMIATGRADSGAQIVHVSADGRVERLFETAGVNSPNGLTWLRPHTYLVADSRPGSLWLVDLKSRSARLWLADKSLTQTGATPFPGANGVKVFRGVVYASSSDRAQMVAIPIRPDGGAGRPRVMARDLVVDDFALDDQGAFYCATHPFNSVVRLTRAGRRTTLVGVDQGAIGTTAVAFGQSPSDAHSLYVIGDGGVMAPVNGQRQPPRLLRLSLDVRGASLGPPP